MKSPRPLKDGDAIRIVSSARKISREEIEPAINVFAEWGLRVQLGKNLFESHHQFAGTDHKRSADLQDAIDDDEVKAVIFARGGYGSVRIIDKLDYSRFIENPKWLCGYSDVTAVHNHVHNLGVQSLHCSMPINFSTNSKLSLESMKKALFGEKYEVISAANKLNRVGQCVGEIVGGNLSMLYSLSGTNSDIDTNGKILFLEDLDEYLYHVDRMMQNLKKSNKLNNLAGLIVGGMTDMNDNIIPYGKTAPEIISEAVSQFHFPICYDFPAGHQKDNRCLILGRQAKLVVDDNGAQINF